ncbi:MAG TPA: translation elongation factor Ts [Sphingopyxis sp.]|nr:translation elongation factor Ts [Sphingopyxis sp.]
MAEITAALVKELRDRTGAGMMDCKKALAENNGDVEASIDWLRTKGLAAAAKKAGRVAAEGLVGVAAEGTRGALVEINSETDFVAKNEQFQAFVRDVTKVALDGGISDIDSLAAATYPTGGTVADALTQNIATIGENQSLRRSSIVSVESGVVAGYVHNAAAAGMGKIGVLVALESTASGDALEALGKQIAMHVAAANPLALNGDDLDADLVARERAIAEEKAAESGKPAEIVAKMVDGAIAKYRKENALLSQLFVMDGKTPVAEVIAAAGKDVGATITLTQFVRFQLGDGIEKEESDFAAEVAKVAGA